MMEQQISLDHWTPLFLFASVQGFFLAFILFMHRKGNVNATKLLALDILLFSLMLLYYVSFWIGFAAKHRWVNGWTEPFNFLFGPLTYLYLEKLQGNSSKEKRWLHFLPAVINAAWM